VLSDKSAVIVCTRDRPSQLKSLLLSLKNQISQVKFKVIIVDSSKVVSTTLKLVESFKNSLEIELLVCPHDWTLPLKRNYALTQPNVLQFQFVHFFDDDIEIESSYLEKIQNAIKDEGIAGGIGQDLNQVIRSPSKLRCLLGLDSSRGGVILASGANVMPKASKGDVKMDIEWMSGCAMSFNSKYLGGIFFDERRTFIGEDTDFTYRTSKKGRLIFCPTAFYKHRSSLNKIPSESHRVKDHIKHLVLLTRDFPERVKPISVYLMLSSIGISWIRKGLVEKNFNYFLYGLKYSFFAYKYLSSIFFELGIKESTA